ncbi:MAG: UDP-N-acetylglucosamine 2-epimerase (non-hydrolyzing) [Clostridia bacterium]|nr:UDP-N-acetylglucosamine 2-epimerase (non-hydrolyzing) [Clostridia bacterium]
MPNRLKLMTIVGTRPEIIRLAAVIPKCDAYFDQILVHTGQNYDYELNQVFFEELRIRQPDIYLDAVGEDLGETLGNIIAKSYRLMRDQRPDALLILGDTNSCLSAISAKRLHIPIFHMEAGNRCFDECLPEESNRRIVDHISDVNLCYSEHARRYLHAEGRPKERTYVTGSPMAEVLHTYWSSIISSNIVMRLGLQAKNYILLSAHREENLDTPSNFWELMNAVNALAETYDMPVFYSCHPRSAKLIEEREFIFDSRVKQSKPLGFIDYNNLQMNAFCVVSDSGTLPEESCYFWSMGVPIPAVCIRTSTERPEAMENGHFIIGGIRPPQVIQAVDIAVRMNQNRDFGTSVPDYADENVSSKVVKIIQSYTRIVDESVWRKPDESGALLRLKKPG